MPTFHNIPYALIKKVKNYTGNNETHYYKTVFKIYSLMQVGIYILQYNIMAIKKR